jgi:hypothetical protein
MEEREAMRDDEVEMEMRRRMRRGEGGREGLIERISSPAASTWGRESYTSGLQKCR